MRYIASTQSQKGEKKNQDADKTMMVLKSLDNNKVNDKGANN